MTAAVNPVARALHAPIRAPTRRRVDLLQITLAGVLLTYVWRVQDIVPGIAALKLPTLCTAAALGVLLVDKRLAHRLTLVSRHPTWKAIAWFTVIAAISAAASISPGWSIDFFLRSLIPALALAIVVPAGIIEPMDAERFAAIQVVGATLYCVAILLEFDVDKDGRLARLVYYDANDIGMLLVCTLPLCAYFIRHTRARIVRLAAFGVALLFLFTIARTGSRGAFLGLVVVGLYLLVRFRSAHVGTRAMLIGATTVLLLVGAGAKYREMMSTILHPTADYNWVGHDDVGRMSIWARGLTYAEEHPITGVGLWAFPVAEGTISPLAARQEYSKGLKWSAAHNSFVQVLAELGVAGFIVFVLLLWRAYRTASRLANAAFRTGKSGHPISELANAHAAALVGYVVSGFFLSQAYAPYLYFVIGMIIGLDVTVRAQLSAVGPPKARKSGAEWRSRRSVPVAVPPARAVSRPAAGP